MFLISNFTEITSNLTKWSLQGYETTLGVVFYAIVFSAIIGYVYLKQQSAVAAVAVILIIVTAFGVILTGLDPWVNFLYLIVAFTITGLILIFVIRKRGGY